MKQHTYFDSPIGGVKIVGTPAGISEISFVEQIPPNEMDREIPSFLDECQAQLEEYFAKKRKKFTIKLNFQGSDFQIAVWKELLEIPYGFTTSYLAVSQKVGDRKAVRAVGQACGQNPIAIIAPCHRVIGLNGNLTGYAGGLDHKRDLLMLENPLAFGKQGSLF